MSLNTSVANWNYSNWRTLTGAAKISQLALHIGEVSDRITENYSIAGFSKGSDPLNAYLTNLSDKYALLGGNTPRSSPGQLFIGQRMPNPATSNIPCPPMEDCRC